MSSRCAMIVALPFALVWLAGCGQAEPEPTAVLSATARFLPATATLAPPTDLPSSEEAPATTPPSAVAPTPVPITFVDSEQRLGLAYNWDVGLGDLDGDGDLDAFVANDSEDGTDKIWLNQGQGVLTMSEQSLGACLRVALGDLDGDGDLDAVATNWDKATDTWLSDASVWLNNGSGVFAAGQQNLGGGEVFNIALKDLDGDGDLDIFFAGIGANTVWLNAGDGFFTDTGQRLESMIAAAVALGDLDGDGDPDALAGGWDGPAKVWLNDGTGAFVESRHDLSPASIHIHSIALGDLDGDGDLDAFMAVASGHPHEVWHNDGTGVFSRAQGLRGPLAHGVSLGDLDGDGDLDAITAHGTTTGGMAKVWHNDGRGFFSDGRISLGNAFSSAVALGDLDGDGDLDAFVTHTRWASRGSGEPNEVWINETLHPAQALPLHSDAAGPALAPSPAGASLGDTWTRPADGMAMIYVPGGTFLMGSTDAQIEIALALCDEYPDDYGKCQDGPFEPETPEHNVTVGSFWIDRTEVTNAQYALCVIDGSCRQSRLAQDPAYNGDEYPVAGIPWQDAADYCVWAGGRLPTEAEWEYAARGEKGLLYPWGNEFDCAGGNFWDDGTGCDDGYAKPAPVGSFPQGSSWCGALNMAGNVWEWVADAYGPYSTEAQVNPIGPASGSEKILRGGSWAYLPAFGRMAYRYPVPPTADYLAVGFRCAVSADD